MLSFSGAAARNNSAAVLFEYGNEWQFGKHIGPTCLLHAVIKRDQKISANCQPLMITTNNLELYCSQGNGWQNRSLIMTMGSVFAVSSLYDPLINIITSSVGASARPCVSYCERNAELTSISPVRTGPTIALCDVYSSPHRIWYMTTLPLCVLTPTVGTRHENSPASTVQARARASAVPLL